MAMRYKVKIRKKDKFLLADDFFGLLNDFINDSYSGRRLKKNGSRISHGTVKNYEYLKKNMLEFQDQSTFELRMYLVGNLNQSQREVANNYYKKFYRAFTNFLYNKKKYFDNYVGLIIKSLRSFFNYVRLERSIDLGEYHRLFFVPSEEIPIISLNKDQLRFIISDEEFNAQLAANGLLHVRDFFVFGCAVALRISDLCSLTRKNLLIKDGVYYLQVKSQKTDTRTSIKLPPFAVDIVLKYKGKYKTLLPPISVFWMNKQLKRMAQFIPDNYEIIKTRERRGKQVVVRKADNSNFKLSDHITTHTMRRTAITNMLCLGMPEHLVRKISGHAANSKEFFRYVKLSQSYLDSETDQVFEKMLA